MKFNQFKCFVQQGNRPDRLYTGFQNVQKVHCKLLQFWCVILSLDPIMLETLLKQNAMTVQGRFFDEYDLYI